MNNNRKVSANGIFSSIIEQKESVAAVSSEPIVNFESGQLIESPEQEVPQVEVGEPKITAPVDESLTEASAVAEPPVPQAVVEADKKIEEAVEGELRARGADPEVVEAEVGAKTELPSGDIPVAKKHDAFVRASGEAAAGDAAEIEEIWDPLE
jgi:hypothetical protein